MIEDRVVVERIHVNPVAADTGAEIDVQFARVFTDHPVAGQAGIDVLHYVVADVPLPDDVPVHVQLDQAIGSCGVALSKRRICSERDDCLVGGDPGGGVHERALPQLRVPDETEIMMSGKILTIQFVLPDNLAVPADELVGPTRRPVSDGLAAGQHPVREQPRILPDLRIAPTRGNGPGVYHFPIHVDEVGVASQHRSKHRIALVRTCGIVVDEFGRAVKGLVGDRQAGHEDTRQRNGRNGDLRCAGEIQSLAGNDSHCASP